MTHTIQPIGDSALLIQLSSAVDRAINEKVLQACAAIEQAKLLGILDVIPSYNSITVHYDVAVVATHQKHRSVFAFLKAAVETILSTLQQTGSFISRQMHIPVCYAPEFALDIESIAKGLNLTCEQIIAIHTAVKYRVYMVGFLPGFAYMGEVDERIAVPRKKEPRLRVEAGSVGIAGHQTGIYPLSSPGGWQIIGKTPIKLFDKNLVSPSLFNAGDEVHFFSITADEFNHY